MKLHKIGALMGGTVLALSMAACGDAGSESETRDVDVKEDAAAQFDDGTKMKELAEAGKITIGVKFDQPGLGFKSATADVPTGFDVEMAKIMAADLGIATEDIKWVETISDNREPFLQKNKVDLVLATYSITDDRRKVVGQAGPYFITGQQILVKEDSDVESIEDLKGQDVCSVTGSTSLDNVKEQGAKPVGFGSYSECTQKVLDGSAKAMSTDGAILLGYAAENPGELKVVGEPFSEERIGVGYPQEATEMCEWINDTILESYEDGSWAEAFELTLGKSGAETPEPPKDELDPCQ